MQVYIEFTPSEIERTLMFVGETFKLGSNPTKTGRGKRLYGQFVTPENTPLAQSMVNRAKYVHSHGLKSGLKFTLEEIRMLKTLEQYCIALMRM